MAAQRGGPGAICWSSYHFATIMKVAWARDSLALHRAFDIEGSLAWYLARRARALALGQFLVSTSSALHFIFFISVSVF